MSQQVKVSQLVKPLADLERTAVNMIKTIPFVMMLTAPVDAAYQTIKADLKTKGYAVPEVTPTPAEIAYYALLNTEMGKPPPILPTPAAIVGAASKAQEAAGLTPVQTETQQATNNIKPIIT